MPGARAGNYFSGVLGRTNRTIPEDAARALADLVLACQPAGLDVVMRVGEAVEGAGGPGLPLCRTSTLGSGGPPPAPGGTAVGGTILAPEVRRSRGGRAVQEPGSQAAAGSLRTRAPGLGRMVGDAAGLHMVLDGGPASEGPQGGTVGADGTAVAQPATLPEAGSGDRQPAPDEHSIGHGLEGSTQGVGAGSGGGGRPLGAAEDGLPNGNGGERLAEDAGGGSGRDEPSSRAEEQLIVPGATEGTAATAPAPGPNIGRSSESGDGELPGASPGDTAAADGRSQGAAAPGGEEPASPAASRARDGARGTLSGWLTPSPGRTDRAAVPPATASASSRAVGAGGATRGRACGRGGLGARAATTVAARARGNRERTEQGRGREAGRSGRLAIGLGRRAEAAARQHRTSGNAATAGNRRRAAAEARRSTTAGPMEDAGGAGAPRGEGDQAAEPDRRRRRVADICGQQQARRGDGDRSELASEMPQGQRRTRAARGSGPGGRGPR